MNILLTRASTILGLVLSIIFSAQSNAVAITKSRLFLEPKSRFTEMLVYNTENTPKECSISLKELMLDNTGLDLVSQDKDPLPSPADLVKLSPKRFELGVKRDQAFKIIYRRRPGIEAGEYIGAVAIKCTDKVENEGLVTIKPALVHNVPLVVRTGNLNANASFTSVKRLGNKVIAELKVEGERSVTGDVRLEEKSTGKVLVELKSRSFYPQLEAQALELIVPENAGSDVVISFTETEESGSLIVKKAVN